MREATALQKFSWVLYDWANSGYGLIVIGPVFPPYLISVLLPEQAGGQRGLSVGGVMLPGSAVIGILTSLSMLLMAVGAPVLGAVADIRGWTRRMLIVFCVAGALPTMAMATLGPGRWLLGSILYVISNFCFGTSFAFYNAFLPRLTRPEKQGSLSGWGFAAGYVGGAIALIIVLVMSQANSELVKWGLAMSGLWWLVFSLPAFVFLPELPPQALAMDAGPLLWAGFRRIGYTFGHIRQYKMLFIFLLAFLLYNDGVETVIAMSSSFGTDYLKMSQTALIVVFLIVQFVAFGGAVAFGLLADRIGNRNVICINLIVWIVAAALAFLLSPGRPVELLGLRTSTGTVGFALLGVLIGIVLGGVQASSRALMALLSPEQIRNEAFGFFSISGKFASIFGPLVYAGLATAYGPRYGIFSVLPFLVGGLLVLLMVKEPQKGESPEPVATPPLNCH